MASASLGFDVAQANRVVRVGLGRRHKDDVGREHLTILNFQKVADDHVGPFARHKRLAHKAVRLSIVERLVGLPTFNVLNQLEVGGEGDYEEKGGGDGGKGGGGDGDGGNGGGGDGEGGEGGGGDGEGGNGDGGGVLCIHGGRKNHARLAELIGRLCRTRLDDVGLLPVVCE